ncbi:LLM class flavin-dependent oxidoreductase [Agrobacterium vitis]|uniref:LLM class flavin-dependent oxidoreductase n=1 Tax=Agrobacterium vitis TaxID=373 RepID=A0AAE2RBN4_AGRVI|nr:LLM class flavin-dependent oxidoreductase [Agrobacterium vitis]MBF2714732.1 LLM class flavin-dependent oxidoreductase [Agrobacterium vitis]MUZ63054.1 LLM class flavin-dependent oxidoreductase [Agrobacterium vitis]MVA19327.1 LLM class flavin-dependent oxidoreductase [Agrobacterium vitis]
MTQAHPFLLGIGVDAAARDSKRPADWQGFWSALIARLDGAASFLTLEDGFARNDDGLDAVLLANWLGARSRSIGIIAGAAVNFLEPFHVSTAIATLDYVTQGRAGLLLQRLDQARAEQAGRALGRLNGFPAIAAHDLDRDAIDAGEVIRRLWDSWEDDTVIRDPVSQRFLDGAKLHYINFESPNFRVLGPSITPRPPQGQPVVALSWTGTEDIALAKAADVVFVAGHQQQLSELAAQMNGGSKTSGPVLVADIAVGADAVERLTQTATAGFGAVRLVLSDPQTQIDQVLHEILPALRSAGLVREPSGNTLRARFGLPTAINRITAAA